MDYAENVVQLLANLTALLLCLFRYISDKRRGWLYAIAFFLCSLLSCYFWTTHLIIMGDCPNGLDWLTYSGWNAAFIILFILLIHLKSPEELRFFHPLMLIPIPLNYLQLTLYLPYGNLLNNIYQVSILTLVAIFSMQGIIRYMKQWGEGVPKPYSSIAALIFVATEFGMWTSTCMYEPFSNLYFLFSFLASADYLFLIWAINRTFAGEGKPSSTTFDRKYQRILKLSYLGIVAIGSLGGIALGFWMRDVMTAHIDPAAASRIYGVIPVVLYVISLILVLFTIAVIFIVYFGQRAAENIQLREARQIAEHSNAAKSEFLANMSHEIRTPINAVMGMNEIILRESAQARERLPEDRDKVREVLSDISGYAGVIDTAGKNLLDIINGILDISRIEAGKLEIRESEYRLSSVLNDVCSMIRFRARSRNLSFLADVSGQLPDRLYGDGVRVRQILLNILSNAVKYTLRGSVTLSVAGEITGADTVTLAITVRDTGVGIREEDLSRLFEKFERIGPGEDGSVEGTGLGLAIVKSLLDMMGGSIAVDSVYGSGSVFTVILPQKFVSAEPIGDFMERFERSDDPGDAPADLFRAPEAHILVVDDTRMNLSVTEGLLKNTEIRIDSALSGSEALQQTLYTPYDLILMDQRMPEMDGTEALHLLREQKDGLNSGTPVICLTADAISGARERYMAEGFTDYLSKPINSRELRRCLLQHLPPEKIIPVAESSREEPAADTEGIASLLAAGIDIPQGLAYCQHDTSLYRSVLGEYAGSAGEKAERLQQYFDAADWPNYAILVHAVKSTSGTIGAARLSETAARLEQAAKQADAETIRQEHAGLIDLYRRTTDAILSVCAPENTPLAEEDGIFEFAPDE